MLADPLAHGAPSLPGATRLIEHLGRMTQAEQLKAELQWRGTNDEAICRASTTAHQP